MLTKAEYLRNISISIDKEELLSRCMESSFLYAVRQYPFIERKLTVGYGCAELELQDNR